MTRMITTPSTLGSTLSASLTVTGRSSRDFSVVVQSPDSPGRSIDVTYEFVAAVARAMYDLHHGNHALNWMEAEVLLRDFLNSNAAQLQE